MIHTAFGGQQTLQPAAIHFGSQQHGAIHQSQVFVHIGQSFEMNVHWQLHTQHIAVLPASADANIALGAAVVCHYLSVDTYTVCAAVGPIRMAQPEAEIPGPAFGNLNTDFC